MGRQWILFAATAAAATAYTVQLDASMVQRLAAAVDASAAMALSVEQLAGTGRSLEEGDEEESVGGDTATLHALGAVNQALRSLLQRLRDELGGLFTTGESDGGLFTTGESDGLGAVIAELRDFPTSRGPELHSAVSAVSGWTVQCDAPGIAPRYAHFEKLHAERLEIDSQLRELGSRIFILRDQRATADGTLAGLEEALGGAPRRSRRGSEEYVLARYLGASLFRWDLLRTKVAHHLAVGFTEARDKETETAAESIAEKMKGGNITRAEAETAAVAELESRLGTLEEQLQQVAAAHKRLAERRDDLGVQLRAFLKSLFLSCEPTPGREAAAVPKSRYRAVWGERFGIKAQAAEEFARFLNMTVTDGGGSLSRMTSVLEELLAPYAGPRGSYALPTTWRAKPKIGRWWEWLSDEGKADDGRRLGTRGSWRGDGWKTGADGTGSDGAPLGASEFERRFEMAKRRFSVRLSASEPIVMAYLLWLLLEEVLGTSVARDGGHTEILSLPGPAPAVADAAKTGASVQQSQTQLV
eukprot:gnl/TRDRNA2_/TRDRNA2_125360_c0_seq1.p1 gnl/TRDRNA2_/TRDRNA2_125360_c0~~gnl/TRDRNA2_/TRDRNA2_125360_c0_seq1.p1  ORF type:complete len:529 (+),score=111.48 gnl/TRDRNA2_/TRDRNA2_125360_c0_seq1:81-1667(+)